MNWYIDVLKKYAVFSGRAGRKEFWMFILFNVIVEIFLWGIEFIVAHTLERNIIANLVILIISLIYTLGILTPSIAVTVRRLHDTGRSGWWVLIGIVPLIGDIVLVVFTVQDSQQGYNQHGPKPKMMETESKRPEGKKRQRKIVRNVE